MKKIYEGKQSFEAIIENDYLYVDKTEYIHNLINDQDSYFLSRPRRFGKSLFLSTLKFFFLGRKDLFKDLSISTKDKNCKFESYPVISLNMAAKSDTSEILEKSLISKLRTVAKPYGIQIDSETSDTAFEELITLLREKHNKKVVILIDEYDYAISSKMGNPSLAADNREVLSPFYAAVKSNDENIRFLFVTGVTHFSLVGLSSAINHITDITLNERYSERIYRN
jgi:hypothetical protein